MWWLSTDHEDRARTESASGYERIRLVIPSSLRLLNFSPFHLPLGAPERQRAATSATGFEAPRAQAGSRLHNHHVCPLTSFRVTTDTAGILKGSLRMTGRWLMTPQPSAGRLRFLLSLLLPSCSSVSFAFHPSFSCPYLFFSPSLYLSFSFTAMRRPKEHPSGTRWHRTEYASQRRRDLHDDDAIAILGESAVRENLTWTEAEVSTVSVRRDMVDH